ncbi:MAG: exodeoxyribonuclease III [Microbacteriaceae bacterium]
MPTRIASVNVNGVRAAFRKGMGDWLDGRGVDILCLQEVRAETTDLLPLLGDGWHVVHDAATAKGRAGVAIASRISPTAVRTEFGPAEFDSAGRWIEADFAIGGSTLTVASAYVHSGEVNTPKQVEKYKFLDAFEQRLAELSKGEARALVVGDLNVGHRTLDIKNWKGNVKNAGFLPDERVYFDRIVGSEDDEAYNAGAGLGWIDLGRRFSGEVAGPYTWWSQRGQAFDTDTGWRLDYHLASPSLAPTALTYAIDKADAWDARWSDHSPVVIDYDI